MTLILTPDLIKNYLVIKIKGVMSPISMVRDYFMKISSKIRYD